MSSNHFQIQRTGKLIVSQSIDKSKVYENNCYLSDTDFKQLFTINQPNNYVQINDGPIFTARNDPDQKINEIGMSILARISANTTTNKECKISSLTINDKIITLTITFQVDVYKEKKRCEVNEDILKDIIKKNHINQIFMINQIIATSYNDTAITLTVKEITQNNPTENKHEGFLSTFGIYGKLIPDTVINIIPNTANRYLIFEKSSYSSSALLKPNFKFADMGIGGLDQEFSSIFRRAFASRLFPLPVIKKLGISHVKGMLLYGPPGTGKTLIARQIGKMLADREPKIVNGPEILNSYVGQSEQNIRNLFIDAENEYKERGDNSSLHIIIFDEIDAICKQRGSIKSSTGVHDAVVNQLLSKIDGINSLNNILIIGMTNRKELIDPALLRPGRLEVHVEIGLPDENGRLQILNIHTKQMRENNILAGDVDLKEIAIRTKNFSGAELEGLVKSASSYALYGNIDVTKNNPKAAIDLTNIKVIMNHFTTSLKELTPAFGVNEDELNGYVRKGIIEYSDEFTKSRSICQEIIDQIRVSTDTSLLSALIEGPSGSGKTSLAVQLAIDSGYPYIKIITPENMIELSTSEKISYINKIFEDAYKSPLSLIIIDNIERLLGYVSANKTFSNDILQCLLILIKKLPKTNRRLCVLATSSKMDILRNMDIEECFNVIITMPQLKNIKEIKNVFDDLKIIDDAKLIDKLASIVPLPISIKQLLIVIDMFIQKDKILTVDSFMKCLNNCKLIKE